MSKSKAVCPKCKSKDLTLVEVWNGATISWEQIDGDFHRDEGNLEPGDAARVEGSCKKCNHRWTLRGILQIDEVIVE